MKDKQYLNTRVLARMLSNYIARVYLQNIYSMNKSKNVNYLFIEKNERILYKAYVL